MTAEKIVALLAAALVGYHLGKHGLPGMLAVKQATKPEPAPWYMQTSSWTF